MIESIRGFSDIQGVESARWTKAERLLRELFARWCYDEVRLPIVERTELFARGIGDDTDIVEKEMYTLNDRGGESITMRPEGTASVIRFFNEHKLWGADRRHRLFYIGPMFRYERPQKGRLRQFHQAGIELLGDGSPSAEADVICLALEVLRLFGIEGAALRLNSIGCAACRPAYRAALLAFFDTVGELCDDCKRRRETNPLRLLDCKNEGCRAKLAKAPLITDHTCAGCRTHFDALQAILADLGIACDIDPFIVRGLDYYSGTVFEIHSTNLGAQSAILAGGRYDTLSEKLGGQPTPSVGWALGIERLLSLLPDAFTPSSEIDAFVVCLGERAVAAGRRLVYELRRAGIAADYEPDGGSMKSQMRRANKFNARHAVIIGDNELDSGTAVVKNLSSGEQANVALAEIETNLKH